VVFVASPYGEQGNGHVAGRVLISSRYSVSVESRAVFACARGRAKKDRSQLFLTNDSQMDYCIGEQERVWTDKFQSEPTGADPVDPVHGRRDENSGLNA